MFKASLKFFTGVASRKATDDEKADDVAKKFLKGLSANAPARERAKRYRRAYDGVVDDLPSWKHPDDPNLHYPYTEVIVDSIVANFFSRLFTQNPFISYNPQRAEDVVATRIAERLVHYYLNERIPDALTHLYLWVEEAALQGYSFLHLYYNKHSRVSYDDEAMTNEAGEYVMGPDGKPAMEQRKNEIVDYEGIQFEVVNLDNIATDWNRVDFRKNWVVIREYINPDDYLDRVKYGGYTPLNEDQLERSIVWGEPNKLQAGVDRDRARLELLHYYGKGYVNADGSGELEDIKLTVLQNASFHTQGSLLVDKRNLRFKPFVILRFKPETGSAGGRGLGDMLYDMQVALNNTFNARMLALSYSLYPGLIIGEGANITDKSCLTAQPMQTIFCDDPTQIMEIKRKPIPPEAFAATDEIKSIMQDVSSAQEIVQGQSSRQELATTAQILNTNAMKRLELHVFRMAKEGIGMLGDVLRQMILEIYNPQDKLVAVLSQDEVERFGGQVDVGPEGILNAEVQDISPAMFASTKVSAVDGDDRAKRQEMLQLAQYVLSLGGQGWPTGEVVKDEAGAPVVDPETGQPRMKFRSLNMDTFIKELYRTWNRHDFKNMFVDAPGPAAGTAGQSGQAATNASPPGHTAAKKQSDIDKQIASYDSGMAGG